MPLSPRPLSSTSSYMLSGGVLMLFPSPSSCIFDTMFFEGQLRSPSSSLTTHFSIINIFCHSFITYSIDVPNPAEHVSLHCWFNQLSWLRISYEETNRVSTTFIFLSFFFFNIHNSLPYNSIDTNSALFTAKCAAVLTFYRLINAAKASLTLLPAAIRLPTSI